MSNADDEKPVSAGRSWHRGDRAKVSLMQVFRASYHDQDARRPVTQDGHGEGVITARSRQRREGVSEAELRRQVETDLASLLNTIRLDSAEPLDDAPEVARSILNYGFRDLSTISARELNSPQMIEGLRQSLIDHEPRLMPDTLAIRVVDSDDGSARQRLALHVAAEFMGDPVDVEVDFDAEVDLGTGTLKMSKLRVQS